ncbi:hypothetical protein DM02DRAFT_693167 [Periconia macrospinosa]|uniref:Uncharacterized protein n=1 Tax=Periconia macrospinosa TaxID=97972 RepID=A0A2V1D8I5_9PLEO|nr:hypothetical protein DM02DRAFT_693167 [Periconia macrospinosa]
MDSHAQTQLLHQAALDHTQLRIKHLKSKTSRCQKVMDTCQEIGSSEDALKEQSRQELVRARLEIEKLRSMPSLIFSYLYDEVSENELEASVLEDINSILDEVRKENGWHRRSSTLARSSTRDSVKTSRPQLLLTDRPANEEEDAEFLAFMQGVKDTVEQAADDALIKREEDEDLRWWARQRAHLLVETKKLQKQERRQARADAKRRRENAEQMPEKGMDSKRIKFLNEKYPLTDAADERREKDDDAKGKKSSWSIPRPPTPFSFASNLFGGNHFSQWKFAPNLGNSNRSKDWAGENGGNSKEKENPFAEGRNTKDTGIPLPPAGMRFSSSDVSTTSYESDESDDEGGGIPIKPPQNGTFKITSQIKRLEALTTRLQQSVRNLRTEVSARDARIAAVEAKATSLTLGYHSAAAAERAASKAKDEQIERLSDAVRSGEERIARLEARDQERQRRLDNLTQAFVGMSGRTNEHGK